MVLPAEKVWPGDGDTIVIAGFTVSVTGVTTFLHPKRDKIAKIITIKYFIEVFIFVN
jgi:hypothetical protein